MNLLLAAASESPERMLDFKGFIQEAGHCVDLLGVLVIIGGILWGIGFLIKDLTGKQVSPQKAYSNIRIRIGRGLVLGLEILVAADIIQTVAIQPTFQNVGVLGLIVLVRTFLGWSLSVELDGHWPWQGSKHKAA